MRDDLNFKRDNHNFHTEVDIGGSCGYEKPIRSSKCDAFGLKFGKVIYLSNQVSDTYLATPDGSYLAISDIRIDDEKHKVVLSHDGSRRLTRFVVDGSNVSAEQREYDVFVNIDAGYHMGMYSFCHDPSKSADVTIGEISGRTCLILLPSANSYPESCDPFNSPTLNIP